MNSLPKIDELVKDLIKKVDNLSTNEKLEAIAAKIIKDVSDKIDKIEKNKQLEILVENSSQEPPSKRRFQKYSFPNFNVGNPSLGSSKCPNALQWPFGSNN